LAGHLGIGAMLGKGVAASLAGRQPARRRRGTPLRAR
jgi:hypothetical protein